MRLDTDNGIVTFVLSERNLRTLLVKLTDPESARTLMSTDSSYGAVPIFAVTAEPDEVHYASETRLGYNRPGPIHPDHEPRLGDV